MRALPLLAGLLLTRLVPVAGPAGEPATAQELAHALHRKIEDVEAVRKAGKAPSGSVVVSEGELNAYLKLVARLPSSLSDLEVRLERDRISARGLLDLDQLQGRLPGNSGLVGLALLGGRMAASVKGRLQGQDGFASFEIEDVRLGSIPLSPAVLQQIVAVATRTPERPEGVDILAPFRYPYSVRRIRLQPGRALVEF